MLPSTNDYDPTDNMKSDVFSKSTVALQGPTSVEEPKLATPVPVNKVATITTEKKQSALISQSQSGGNLFSIQSNPSGTNKSAGKKNVLFDTDSDEEDIFSGTSKNVLPTMAGKLNEQKVPVVPVQKGSMKQAVISVKGSLFSDLSDGNFQMFYFLKGFNKMHFRRFGHFCLTYASNFETTSSCGAYSAR